MKFRDRVKAGLAGKYKGLPNGFKKLNTYIFGIQKACYTLIGGQSGTYKTTLLDFMIYNAIVYAKEHKVKLNIKYYSFEIDELTKRCNWMSVHIYKKYGIFIAPETIKGLGDNRLSEEQLKLVEAEEDYLNDIFSSIEFTYSSVNPTGIYNTMWEFMESRGKLITEPYQNSEGKIEQKVVKYIPNDPDEITLGVIDHLYYLRTERKFTTKEKIDKMSEYAVQLRNIFGVSWFMVQQFNQGLSSVERAKHKGADLTPQQTDFKDSTNPYQDADVVLGIMCPFNMDQNECLKYDIRKLRENFILLKIIKNRLSKSNISLGLLVHAKAGSFIELPPATEMTNERYEKALKLLNNDR